MPQQGGLQGYQGFQPTPQPQQQAPAALAPAPAPEPPMPIEKGPIPSEHQILQEVFDGLKDKCVVAANHPVRHEFYYTFYKKNNIVKLSRNL